MGCIEMTIAKQLLTSNIQTWSTPKYLFDKLDDIFNFKLDPCCEHETAKCEIHYTKEDDGLKQDWSKTGNAFVNPPFGRALPIWMKKCFNESQKGITVVMLIPARPDSSHWHNIAFRFSSCICFMKGRITFGGGLNPAPFPSAIIVFGKCSTEQKQKLKQFGWVVSE